MQNAFLTKVQKSLDNSPLSLAQTNSPGSEMLQAGLEGSGLKNIYETKFMIWNTEWSVVDWTIFCIVVAIIIVAVLLGLLFCCCVGSTEAQELKEAREKAEKEEKDKDFMEYKAGEQSLVKGLGEGAAAGAAAADAPKDDMDMGAM